MMRRVDGRYIIYLCCARVAGKESDYCFVKKTPTWSIYTRPGSNWRPLAREADFIATRPLVPCMLNGWTALWHIVSAAVPRDTVEQP